LDNLLEEAKKNESKVIKMQANIRGFIQRKAYRKSNDFVDPKPLLSKRSHNKLPGAQMLGDKGRPIIQGS
jgi:hypothetical protein